MFRPVYHTLLPTVMILLVAYCMQCSAMSASEKEEYERRGLSQVEWEMVLDAKMPLEKVDELQKAGITITEYFRYPWLSYNISEEEWIRSRKAGLLESDIAAENKPMEKTPGTAVFSAFVLPGYHQLKQKQYIKGAIMTSSATFAAVYMTARSIHEGALVPGPLLILFPMMLWSSLDVGFRINKEHNPDASRFSSADSRDEQWRVSLCIQSR